jgi:hypothetical protein
VKRLNDGSSAPRQIVYRRSEGSPMLFAAVLSAWIQYGFDGNPQARALVTHGCPSVTYDGASIPMSKRAPQAPEQGFDEVVCEAKLPATATGISIEGHALPAPPRTLKTIVVFGDTGCRLKGGEQQNCGDIAAWPFPKIAQSIANVRADLAIHVGDYYYRENNCVPGVAGCVNYWGDTSMSWNADWFTPAKPLFASVPLVLLRGNHEDCRRGGPAWFRYLEPSENTTCPAVPTAYDGTAPYAVFIDGLRLVMLDSAADSSDVPPVDPERVAYYKASLEAARALAARSDASAWFLTHRPPYASANMTAVLSQYPIDFSLFDAVLVGHVHDFVAVNLPKYPPLIVNGESGDDLDDANATQKFVTSNGYALSSPAYATKQFGFAVYTRTPTGWLISLRDVDGIERTLCTLDRSSTAPARSTVRCP